ncbi:MULTISPECIES: hypothetical protein [Burkholderia cepacia complex]|uniref:hypothetical protein n=1 Tax=Burkholderia cepacia complex TaxID=87882 RepID=UPI000A6826F7|nr:MULTISPECIES: hypothetical protein [Burkholderia cepacia complex]
MASHPTPSSQQRANVLRAYRYRGRRDRQLYLSYSVKTDRDCILPSNYRFLHWLLYLEADPNVIAFELRDDAAVDNGPAIGWDDVHAWATMRDRRVVAHRIVADERAELDKVARSDEENTASNVRFILQSDLREKANLAMRYAKVVCFAAALRGQRLDAPTILLSETARSTENGTVQQLLDAMPDVGEAIAKGLIARLAIKGWLSLDLSHRSFTQETRWQWEGAA